MPLIANHSEVIGPIACDRTKVISLKEGGTTCPETLSITTEVFNRILIILSTHLADPELDTFFNMWITEEWRVNALEHGNKGDPDKKIQVILRIEELADDTARILFVCLAIADEGAYFDPAKVPDPTVDQRVYLQGGRGLKVAQDLSFSQYGHKLNIQVDDTMPPTGAKIGKTVTLRWAKFEEK